MVSRSRSEIWEARIIFPVCWINNKLPCWECGAQYWWSYESIKLKTINFDSSVMAFSRIKPLTLRNVCENLINLDISWDLKIGNTCRLNDTIISDCYIVERNWIFEEHNDQAIYEDWSSTRKTNNCILCDRAHIRKYFILFRLTNWIKFGRIKMLFTIMIKWF